MRYRSLNQVRTTKGRPPGKRPSAVPPPLIILLGLAGAVAITLYGFARFSAFPELEEFLRHPLSRDVLDRRGRVLYREDLHDGTRREWTPLEEIPRGVVQAFIAGEDQRFFSHRGVDPLAAIRAAFQNLREKRTISGASTITMQLARIIAPHGGGIRGKALESWNALRLETRLKKQDLLELYLNRIPFGRGAEGVASAAMVYFGRPLETLSPPQAALLSVFPRSPSRYNPQNHPEGLQEAAVLIGRRMNPPQVAAEIQAALDQCASLPRQTGTIRAPHFALRVLREHPQDTTAPPSSRSRLRTTLDMSVQQTAETLAASALAEARDQRLQNAAVLVIENSSGDVLAYVGNTDFFDHSRGGQIDAVRIRRQPGSTLKPFLYALALEQGYTAASILPDIPLALGSYETYIPRNFDHSFSGPVRLREALASSLNIPAVWMVSRLGVGTFVDQLVRLGFDLEPQRTSAGAGIALGSVEVTLEELTRAYTAFINNGRALELRFIPGQGPPESLPGRGCSPATAGIIRDILGDAPSRFRGFGHYSLLRTAYPSFFKTGTANQFSNIWAVGASPEITVGVWMGNVHGQTVQGLTGSSVPARVVVGILDHFSSPGSRFPEIPHVQERWISSISGGEVSADDPYAVLEYFLPGTGPDPDTWHRGPAGEVLYPPEYAPWAQDHRLASRPTPATPGSTWGKPDSTWGRITHPNNGAQYFPDPYLKIDESQALRIEIVGEGSWLGLYKNSVLIKQASPPFRVHQPLSRGRHILELKDQAGEVLDRVHFHVGR
ncbi:penicillin-binding protein 1C [Alkalispirochaeta americana]|uniref:peptidoglycan glycosyltransferase n=1 Tax=Alkalispirochaeta americana TaxID=159291 RepID=A0A1N6QV31_9SPIO|nr:penicillin-binding protein 1C [Alkalispirochaeta americana]SIQ20433.1 penicillin-binding protein 1C [Alkalispirochaeta americana]